MTRPSKPGSVAAYASARYAKPLTGSGSAAVKRQPRSSRSGSTTVSPIASSSRFSLRTISVRDAHGQASET